jgi:hypothetical protein
VIFITIAGDKHLLPLFISPHGPNSTAPNHRNPPPAWRSEARILEPDERGHPRAVFRERGQRWIRVASIQDRWRIDDCWWQVEHGGEVSRMYELLELQGAQLMTVYRDLTTGYWFEQKVSAPVDVPTPIDVFTDVRPVDEGMTLEAVARSKQREWADRRQAR